MKINLFNSIEFFESLSPNQVLKSYFKKKFFEFTGSERINKKGEKEKLIKEVSGKNQYWITSVDCNAKAILL